MKTDRVRICGVGTFPRVGREGMGRASFELAQRLGHDTLFITPARSEPVVNHAGHVRVMEIPVTDRPLPQRGGRKVVTFLGYARKFSAYAAFFARSAPSMVRFRPDVVHIHSIQPVLHALFGKLFGARALVTFHGTDLYRAGGHRLFRAAMKFFDGVFYVSRAMEPLLADCVDPERLHYIPNGVDLDRFFPDGDRRDDAILSVGVLKWQKGIDVLLRAFTRFSRTHPGWKLRIAGDGLLADECHAMSRSLGISDKVEWLGHLSQAELVGHYRTARIFAMASLTEGLPKALLEALACGTPAVTTNVGSCREVAGDAGVVVPPDRMTNCATRSPDWPTTADCGRGSAPRRSKTPASTRGNRPRPSSKTPSTTGFAPTAHRVSDDKTRRYAPHCGA
jgi:glycosyltransferase involved in cell wall biosynthesis